MTYKPPSYSMNPHERTRQITERLAGREAMSDTLVEDLLGMACLNECEDMSCRAYKAAAARIKEQSEQIASKQAVMDAALRVGNRDRDRVYALERVLTLGYAMRDEMPIVQEWPTPLQRAIDAFDHARALLDAGKNTCPTCGHGAHPEPPAGEGCGCYDPEGVCGRTDDAGKNTAGER